MSGRLISPTMVGRDRELDRAVDSLVTAGGGAPSHLLITGEAGVGKSRLAAELASAAEGRGMRVLRGACANVGEGGLPYGPLVEALRGLAHDLPPAERAALVGPDGAELARLVPALAPEHAAGQTAPPTTTGIGAQPEWAQSRLLEAILGIVHRLSEQSPLVFIVEDLHWADPATRDAIAYLVRSLRHEPVALAMTIRSDELHRRHPMRPWLAELERTGRTERIDLERLDEAHTAVLAGAILATTPDPAVVRRIHQRSDGNPFFIEELLAAEQGTGHAGLPPTLREILSARLGALPDSARPVLAAVAVAGHGVDHALLAAVSGLPDVDLDAALRVAIEGQVLVAAGGYGFRHALLQEAAYDDLLPGERLRLHRAVASQIAARPVPQGAAAAGHWAELAHHWRAARDDHRALEASVRASAAASDAFAFADARRHAEHALELWSTMADPEAAAGIDRTSLLERAARAAWLAGDPRRGVAWYREAVASLPEDSDPIDRAVRMERLARALWTNGQSTEAMTVIESAVATIPPEPPTAERARVLSGYGQMLMLMDRPAEAIETCRAAIDMARLTGARHAEGHALNSMGLSLAMAGECETGTASLEAALAIAREMADPDDIGRASVNLCEARMYCGDTRGAMDVVLRGMAEAEQVGTTGTYGYYIRENGIDIAFELGDTDTARRLMEGGRDEDMVGRQQYRYALAQSIQFLVAMGDPLAEQRLAELRERVLGHPVEAQFNGPYRVAAIEAALWAGDPAAALEEARAGLAEIGDIEWLRYPLRLMRGRAWAVADLAEIARARRDHAGLAAALAEAEDVRAQRAAVAGRVSPTVRGAPADEIDAELATIDAELARASGTPAAQAWMAVAARWADRPRPYLQAYAAWRAAEAHLLAGDRPSATTSLIEAAGIARRMGAMPLLAAIEGLAARARIAIEVDGQGTAPGPGTADEATDDRGRQRRPSEADRLGLTKREREVLGLVAQGWTNRQIAESLFISENTAGVHVSNILGKLGAATRTEAAAIAARLGLGGA
jgi:DNA-binding CsgD family transcriptional regulator/tetratricopeptide (TPR) repeat protein